MKDRIRALRKQTGMTQQEFADKISVARGNLAKWEIGDNLPSSASVALICRTFGCSEEWLRTGEGEMFTPRTREEEIAEAIGGLLDGSDSFRLRMIKALAKLPADAWEKLEEFCKELLEE